MLSRALDLMAGRSRTDPVVRQPSADGAIDAGRLRSLGDPLASLLDTGHRTLVHLVAGRNVETLAAYLTCLRLGHAVALLDERLPAARQAVAADAFRPGIVVDARDVAAPAAPGYRVAGTLGRATILRRTGGDGGEPPPDGVGVLLPTSGSLGGFRLVCLSYDSLAENARAIAASLDLVAADRAAVGVPLGYSYGLSVVNSHLISGGTLALPAGAPTATQFWRDFHAAACTTFAGVPETYRLLVAAGHDWSQHPSLRLATQAGGRMPPALVLGVADDLARDGAELAVMYGQTEATARIACHRGGSVRAAPHTVGTPVPGTRVWLADADGAAVPEGATGQIMVDGPGLMLGYVHDRSELVALPPRPVGSLATGDVGRWDAGRLEVRGRLARRAKPLGVRVELDEVEAVFAAHGPAAVVADEDVLRVYVEGSVAPYRPAYTEVLRAYLLPPAAVRVISVPEIPRTAFGKVAYGELAAPDPTGASYG